MAVVSGRIAWGQHADEGGGPGGLKKQDFFSLRDDGNYLIALLEQAPQPFKEHWTTNSQGQPRSVRCALRNCSICKEAQALMANPDPKMKDAGKSMMAKTKYAIEVYVLAEKGQKLGESVGRPAILEMNKQIFDGITSIKNTLDQTGGEIMETIFHINRNKGRKPNIYQVTSVPKALKFTPQQQELIDTFRERSLDLGKLYAPPTDESNLAKLGRTEGATVGANAPAAAQTTETGFDDDAW